MGLAGFCYLLTLPGIGPSVYPRWSRTFSRVSSARGVDRMTRRPFNALFVALLGAGLVFAGGGVASGVGSLAPSWKITPVLSGLDGPRGLAFDGHGNLYVAEAGMFFPISGQQFGVSQTGKVGKFSFDEGAATLRWSTAFNSLYDTFLGGGPEVLGPAGISAAGNQVLAIVSESRDGVHKVTPGLLFRRSGISSASTAPRARSLT